MLEPDSCNSSMVRSISVRSREGKLVLSVNFAGISRPFPAFSDKYATESAQAYTSANVAVDRNVRCTRCPAGKRSEIRDFASASATSRVAACRLLRSSSSRFCASCRSSASCIWRRSSSATRWASACSRSWTCCSSSRFRSISRASWYSRSCCSRKCLSSTCCSRRATISARCISISSRQAAKSATAASSCTSPWREPMTRISETLTGKTTQNMGYWRAWIICETWCVSMRAMSPPHRRKFSSSIVRMNSLLSTWVQKLCVYREFSLCR
mmetsp:Transcript_127408/g.271613  ORF Transcript_127408/g.271613 Transcript_127408/m.271613 type:complete len:269 (+) Transcript_127408:149-955(+)